MRLLQATTLKLMEFVGEVPPYAILSHTWGLEEIVFHDMYNDHRQLKIGWEKVRICCAVALRDGLEYVWIDTCCIDKSSSAELSEAINSMYRWYEDSTVCYVYLSDVSSDTATDIVQSRWFTRGWTLQELLAPKNVRFFNLSWAEVGNKHNLQQPLSDTTGIPVEFILGLYDIKSASVAQRMSWASKRMTTRVEDIAYSLMGIFGVNMPLLYGEGEKAFQRLQDEIMRHSEDQSLFVWRHPCESNCSGLLAPSPAAFAGSGDIVRLTTTEPLSYPSTITNRGVQMMIPLTTMDESGLTLAVLNCTRIGQEDKLIALPLRQHSASAGQFERVETERVDFVDAKIIASRNYKKKRIIVQREIGKRQPVVNRKISDPPPQQRETMLPPSRDMFTPVEGQHMLNQKYNGFERGISTSLANFDQGNDDGAIPRGVSDWPTYEMSPQDNLRVESKSLWTTEAPLNDLPRSKTGADDMLSGNGSPVSSDSGLRRSEPIAALESSNPRTNASKTYIVVDPSPTLIRYAPSDVTTHSTNDVDSIFTGGESTVSSQSSMNMGSIQYSGIIEVTQALLSDSELKGLYTTAVGRVSEIKCRAHFRGFLKSYASNLKLEASDHLENQAAVFVTSMAGKVSDTILTSIYGDREVKRPEEEVPGQRLNDWLSSIKLEGIGQNVGESSQRGSADGDEANSDDGSSTDHHEQLPMIHQVKDFMLSAQAFDQMVREIKAWLKVDEKQALPSTESPKQEHNDTVDNADPRPTSIPSEQFADANPELIAEDGHFTDLIAEANTFNEASGDNQEESVSGSDSFARRRRSVPEATTHPSSLVVDGVVASQETIPRPSLRDNLAALSESYGITQLLQDAVDVFMPPVQPGYRRLRWRCSCGTSLWGDFSDDNPEALQKLRSDLHHVPGTITVLHEGQRLFRRIYVNPSVGTRGGTEHNRKQQDGTDQQTRNKDMSGGSASPHMPNKPTSLGTTALQQAGGIQPASSVPGSADIGASFVPIQNLLPSQFFEVCVNKGNHDVRVQEINMSESSITSDGDLFQEIWHRYSQNRGYGIRSVFLKPRDVHFVMFSVDRKAEGLTGIHKRPDEYPPQEEVDKRRYHYRCPKIIMPANVFLHYLHRARSHEWKEHSETTWLQLLPKKLDTSIFQDPQLPAGTTNEDLVFGWGVHILEGPNHAGLSIILAVGIVISFCVSVMVIGLSKTQEQGFGIGSFLMAIVACSMAAVYFSLVDLA